MIFSTDLEGKASDGASAKEPAKDVLDQVTIETKLSAWAYLTE